MLPPREVLILSTRRTESLLIDLTWPRRTGSASQYVNLARLTELSGDDHVQDALNASVSEPARAGGDRIANLERRVRPQLPLDRLTSRTPECAARPGGEHGPLIASRDDCFDRLIDKLANSH